MDYPTFAVFQLLLTDAIFIGNLVSLQYFINLFPPDFFPPEIKVSSNTPSSMDFPYILD